MEDSGRKIGCPRRFSFNNRGGGVPADTPTLKSVCVADMCEKRWLFKEDGQPKFPLYWSQDHYSHVFSLNELTLEEIVVVEALQAFKKKHGVLGCHRTLDGGSRSLKDRLGDMAGNNTLALAEKRAKREAAKKAAAAAIAVTAAAAGSSSPHSSQPGDAGPIQGLPEKRARMEEVKDTNDSGKGGQRVFKGTSASEMKDFLGQVGTWCLRGAMMAEFFHNTIGEVAALPQIKKDFEVVTQKLKDDEVKMKDALGKVKGLSEDNLKLNEKNDKLLEEIEKLKLDLAAKKSETIQVVLEKQKTVEDFEAAKEDWKLKEASYEKEIRRVEDLWDESAECFFHNAIDQIRYLNPGTELRTKGMSTLCVVRDGKWYRGVGKYFVEELSGEEEFIPPPMQPIPLEADAAREDKKVPTESEMVDAQVLGLDESKPPEGDRSTPPEDAAKE
ncbi:hypothetical protein SESBI_13850 [Sesbania bispinosa]|nr:hypothetical protein SESBI_13850 [Sesbania bispinosa]